PTLSPLIPRDRIPKARLPAGKTPRDGGAYGYGALRLLPRAQAAIATPFTPLSSNADYRGSLSEIACRVSRPLIFPTFSAGRTSQLELPPQASPWKRTFFSSTGWLLLSGERIASRLEETSKKDVAMAHAGFHCRLLRHASSVPGNGCVS